MHQLQKNFQRYSIRASMLSLKQKQKVEYKHLSSKIASF